MKIFINITFLVAYQTSLAEDIIFPFYKRATSTGICNLIARLITIFSSIVAEMPRPQPAIFLISVNALALIASFFLPSYKEEEEFERKYKFKSKI